eukprot:CAMPEP_0117420680 /NCGR_PEP_ID=MMETSP0758-20121206/1958_1 /TAXON_ID=63605 /ORGANISM="Percolomonas cosmopolitus, Strain AE-1 (ATCC 50343)" /LENGTH=84 /DNA_ID=CAMNT_0005202419 /DNA_START=403 /DNA_END=654 /DNA_ORIENTATION=-
MENSGMRLNEATQGKALLLKRRQRRNSFGALWGSRGSIYGLSSSLHHPKPPTPKSSSSSSSSIEYDNIDLKNYKFPPSSSSSSS